MNILPCLCSQRLEVDGYRSNEKGDAQTHPKGRRLQTESEPVAPLKRKASPTAKEEFTKTYETNINPKP